MSKLLTPEGQQGWLKANFGNINSIQAKDRVFYTTPDMGIQATDGQGIRALVGKGPTQQESISDLYNLIISHSSGEHLILRRRTGIETFRQERLKVHPETLSVVPWTPPEA